MPIKKLISQYLRKRLRMVVLHRSVGIIGIIALLLIFSFTPTYAITMREMEEQIETLIRNLIIAAIWALFIILGAPAIILFGGVHTVAHASRYILKRKIKKMLYAKLGNEQLKPRLSPSGQDIALSRIAHRTEPDRPKIEQPPLASLHERSTAILSKLASAREQFNYGEETYAILDLYRAVNGTISLILEAEGLSSRGPDGKELPMKEKVRLLVERGWVSPNDVRYFRLLQFIRNKILHSPERIHETKILTEQIQVIKTSGGEIDEIIIRYPLRSYESYKRFMEASHKLKLKLFQLHTHFVEDALMKLKTRLMR
jgi:hypothetical protein